MRKVVAAIVLGWGAVALSPGYALDGGGIDRWLASAEELRAWSERHGEVAPFRLQPRTLQRGEVEESLNKLLERYPEARSIVRSHGFAEPGEWAETGERIYRAAVAVEAQGSDDIRREMQQALRRIEDDPRLSGEERTRLRRKIQQQMQDVTGFFAGVPEGDRKAVQARREAILEIMRP